MTGDVGGTCHVVAISAADSVGGDVVGVVAIGADAGCIGAACLLIVLVVV